MSMNKLLTLAGALVFLFNVGTRVIAAQQSPSPKPSSSEASSPVSPGTRAYRIDFTLSEMAEGKEINSRQYSMDVDSGDRQQLHVGTSVPISVKVDEKTYLDVGTTIIARLVERNGDLLADVQCDISDFVVEPVSGNTQPPLMRKFNIGASTIVNVGKPMLIGVADDPNSKHQFQLKMTVTQLK